MLFIGLVCEFDNSFFYLLLNLLLDLL